MKHRSLRHVLLSTSLALAGVALQGSLPGSAQAGTTGPVRPSVDELSATAPASQDVGTTTAPAADSGDTSAADEADDTGTAGQLRPNFDQPGTIAPASQEEAGVAMRSPTDSGPSGTSAAAGAGMDDDDSLAEDVADEAEDIGADIGDEAEDVGDDIEQAAEDVGDEAEEFAEDVDDEAEDIVDEDDDNAAPPAATFGAQLRPDRDEPGAIAPASQEESGLAGDITAGSGPTVTD